MAEFQQHLSICDNSEKKLRARTQRLTDEKVLACEVYECQLCGENCFNAKNLQQHVSSHSTLIPDLIKCSFKSCERVFYSSEELRKHRKGHYQTLQIVCEICNTHFTNKTHLAEHMKEHTQEKSTYACEVPGCSFLGRLPAHLDLHKKTNHSSFHYTCLRCTKKIFKNPIDFKIHMAQHDAEPLGDFKCIHRGCNQLFQNGDDLEKHTKLTHMNDSQQIVCNFGLFQCKSCSFSYKTESDLQMHKINAHAIWPHSCELCGKGFYSSKIFQKHVQAHKTVMEGFVKCVYGDCHGIFSVPSDLRTHMKTHWKKMGCDVPDCTFSCNSKGDLQLHKSSVHSIWLHNCKLCGKGFDRTNDLKQHMESHVSFERLGVLQSNYKECRQTFNSPTDLKNDGFLQTSYFIEIQQENQMCDEDFNQDEFPKIAEEQKTMLFKDEIEEVVFD